jgi:hypothetical protein
MYIYVYFALLPLDFFIQCFRLNLLKKILIFYLILLLPLYKNDFLKNLFHEILEREQNADRFKCVSVPRSNMHGRKRPHTKKYDDLHVIVLRSYISVSYTDENAIVYGLSKRRLHTISVFLRIRINTIVYGCGDIRSYTDAEIYDRNTITGITAKHGRKRPYFPRIRSYTTVYGVRNIRPG